MINKLNIKFGSTPNQPKLEVDITPITVFVGPNNSGKSKILIEIETYARTNIDPIGNLIIDSILFSSFNRAEMEDEIAKIEINPKAIDPKNPGAIVIRKISSQNRQGTSQWI